MVILLVHAYRTDEQISEVLLLERGVKGREADPLLLKKEWKSDGHPKYGAPQIG